nr:hypothetical protein [Tanacetum cinerariifolium]
MLKGSTQKLSEIHRFILKWLNTSHHKVTLVEEQMSPWKGNLPRLPIESNIVRVATTSIVDAAEDFKEYTLRDYYCWLKTYCCWLLATYNSLRDKDLQESKDPQVVSKPAYLTKSDASEGFDQILDFLNASAIQYALTEKVIITKDTVHQALRLDDAESIDCLPNEEIFTELERMGYEKPSTKLTFYKAFFSAQWKFLIHTILQCMSSKRTAWNEFNSFMASAVICLAIVLYVSKIPTNDDTYTRWVRNGFYGVDTPLFEGMLVPQQAADDVDDVVAEDAAEPTLPSPTTTPPPPQELPSTSQVAQAIEIIKLKQRVRNLEKKNKVKALGLRRLKKERIIVELDVDKDVTLEEVDAAKDAEIGKDANVQERQEESQAQVYHIELEHTDKVLTNDISSYGAATTAASIITAAPNAARKRKGVVIRDPEETATPSTIVHSKPKSKDKGKGILVEKPKPLKKKARIEQDEAYAREGMSYDDIKPIFEKYFNSNVSFLEKSKEELGKEASMTLKRKSEISKQQAAKKQKLDEEVEELKNIYKLEDLEMLWKIVQERFASSKPKNFSDDFLLNTLKAMFEKPDVEAQVWKNQRSIHGLEKVKAENY